MTSGDRGGTASDDDPSFGTDPWVQTAQRYYDPNRGEELTTAIVFAVADAAGVRPVDMESPRLYDCFDAAALEETFFGPDRPARSPPGAGVVEFRYGDYLVKVRNDGWIQVYEGESP